MVKMVVMTVWIRRVYCDEKAKQQDVDEALRKNEYREYRFLTDAVIRDC